MRTEYHVTGDRRKEMVKTIETILGENAVYMRMPTCAFQIGDFTVTKEGALEWADETDNAVVERVTTGLEKAGFSSDVPDQTLRTTTVEDMPAETTPAADEEDAKPEEPEAATAEETGQVGVGLTIELPRSALSDDALTNLRKIIDSKASLLKKAIGTDCLDIIVTDDKIAFPWFPEPDADSFVTYTRLVDRLCEMARSAKRVTATDHPVESERYAMRCFLIRLGFTGPECKKMRNLLLRNLSGSSAFRTQADAEAFNQKLKEKRRKEAEDAVS